MLSTLIGGKSRRRDQRSLSAEGDRGFFPLGGMMSSSGQNVTAETAPRVAGVYACVRVLSETLASAPCITYRKRGTSGRDRATNLPIYTVLHDRPNQWQTAFEFWEMAMVHLALRGNFYASIVPGISGAVTELYPLHPDRMKIKRLSDSRLLYVYSDPDTNATREFNQENIFHIRGMSTDGINGISVIQYQRDTIGSAMAADKYASSYFKNDATPGMVLGTDQPLTAEARNETAAQWNKRHAGSDRAHMTAVLSNGLKPIPISVNNRDSQFIELRNYSKEEIASIFRVPPHLVGIMTHATFSNIEQQSLEFVMYTMLPWFRRIEAAIRRDLIQDDKVFVEFLVDGLLRGDIQSRYAAYAIGRNNGWLNANEIRERENLNDMGPEGDAYLVQGAMITLETAINQAGSADQQMPTVEEKPEEDTTEVENAKEIPATQDMQPVIDLVNSLVEAKDESIKSKDAVIESKDIAILAAEEAIKAERNRAELAERLAAEKAQDHKEADEQLQAVSSHLEIAKFEAEQSRREREVAEAMLAKHAEKEKAILTASRRHAADEYRRMIALESNMVGTAAKKHDFLGAIDKFYSSHRQRMSDALRTPLEIVRISGGGEFDSDQIAVNHCDESLSKLLDVAGMCTATELPDAVTNLMAGWNQRAEFLEN